VGQIRTELPVLLYEVEELLKAGTP
jgi:hypothetical protein